MPDGKCAAATSLNLGGTGVPLSSGGGRRNIPQGRHGSSACTRGMLGSPLACWGVVRYQLQQREGAIQVVSLPDLWLVIPRRIVDTEVDTRRPRNMMTVVIAAS